MFMPDEMLFLISAIWRQCVSGAMVFPATSVEGTCDLSYFYVPAIVGKI